MKVVLTVEALADLEDIGDFIAQDNPLRADSFMAELAEKARELADFPKRFPVIPRYAKREVRRRTYGRYLIIYRVERDHVLVLRIMAGSRNYEALLFPDA